LRNILNKMSDYNLKY